MAVINKSALVPYAPNQMFVLVDDIAAYAEFLPWCSDSTVLSRSDREVTAMLGISHGEIGRASCRERV